MKAIINVTLRKGVLDPQGKAIEHALHGLGFEEAGNVRQGKTIEMDVPEGTDEARIKDMCEKLLTNPVIEDYDIRLVA